ncbi:MarP family serine protease [Pengzhenrongella sp.]|jgi:S1-C subfamily serine protease|uniref:MarP family serine protease n=1 Tax=Pengzhenrongella sp. TaxID=2888820 RepID=UPI002F947536
MNVVTVIMIVALLIGVVHGYRLGLGWVVLPSAGFVAGFLLGVRLAPLAMRFVEHPAAKFAAAVVVTIILTSLGAALGRFVARSFDTASDRLHLGWVNRTLGAGLQAAIVLVVAWLLASGASTVDAFGLGRQVQTSPVIRALNDVLPTPPDIVSRLRGIISPNGFPNVFLAGEPRTAVITPGKTIDPATVATASGSVVQVIGVGCGGLVEGSGFVVAPGVVVTNAHVVAGVGKLTVTDGAGRHAATVVHFDPDEDLAVLTSPAVQAPALRTDSSVLPPGATGAVLGYPGGGPLRESGSVVLRRTIAVGQNIYGKGTVNRSVYTVAANIEPGSSGGPLLTSEGTVAGVVFAKSVTQDDVGYALTWSEVAADVRAASTRTAAVPNGACTTG